MGFCKETIDSPLYRTLFVAQTKRQNVICNVNTTALFLRLLFVASSRYSPLKKRIRDQHTAKVSEIITGDVPV